MASQRLKDFGRACIMTGFLLAMALPLAAQGNGQEVALADRAPRFLYAASAQSAPRPVDVNRAPVLKRKVALDLRDATLSEALMEVTRQAGLRFVYSRDVLDPRATVDLRAEQITVAAALTEILLGEGIDVLFSSASQAALVKRPRASAVGLPGGRGTVDGRVLDKETGTGIPGANVTLTIPDSVLRTVSGDSGKFRFTNVPEGEHAIAVRFIGYQPLTQKIAVQAEPVEIDLALVPTAVKLDELVTTYSGEQRRRDVGNAITTIRADSVLETAPIRNVSELLENRVPGLMSQRTTGAPGDPIRQRLRGVSSITRSSDPIVIVDGQRIYANQSEARNGNLTNLAPVWATAASPPTTAKLGNRSAPAPSPLDQIDPNTIEKIEVLKGPSAATLYGPDAANGVIVITTKQGRPGPTRWNATFNYGTTDLPGSWPVGYYRWGNKELGGGVPDVCPLTDLNCTVDSLVLYQALNDPELTMLGRGHDMNLSLSASGGNGSLTYAVTGSYGNEVGYLQLPEYEVERFRTRYGREAPDWMRRPHNLEEWSVTSNLGARLSPTAEVDLRASVSRSDQQRSTLENRLPMLAGTYVDQVNGLYYGLDGAGQGGVFNVKNFGIAPSPRPFLVDDYFRRTTASTITFTAGLSTNWRPKNWFTGTARAGLDVVQDADQLYFPDAILSPEDSGAVAIGNGRSLVSNFRIDGTASKPLGLGLRLDASIGADLTTTTTNDLAASTTAPIPGTSSLAGANHERTRITEFNANTSSYGWYIEPRIRGQRFSLGAGIRIDGSSSNGTTFSRAGGLGSILGLPKLNGAWVISEESWFPFKSLFSSLQLRGAYGQAQKQPGPIDRLRLYTQRSTVEGEILQLTSLGNAELKPERVKELEGGFLADLLDSRLSIDFALWRKTTVDALAEVTLPLSVNGGGSAFYNLGNIRNQGIDVDLTISPIQSPNVHWSIQVIYSKRDNKLLKLGNGVLPSKELGIVEGFPLGSRWAKPILGYTDQNDNAIIEQGEIQVGDSLVYMGRLEPDYATSLFTNLNLFGGSVGIAAGFTYESGATQVDSTARENWVLSPGLSNPNSTVEEQVAALALGRTDYGLTHDLSTFRFASVSVNYRAPAQVARLFRAQHMTIGIMGSNLALNTTYSGKDPNVTAWRTRESTVDTGQLPRPRTWQLRVNLQY